jgi:dolichol kinase
MLELRRQAFHAFLGIVLVSLLYFNLIGLKFLIITFVLGLIASYISKKRKIKCVEWFLSNFDREINLRGKGVLTYFIGVILSVFLFEKQIALASIVILALGDSFCHLGRFGSIRHPFNNLKYIEGVLIGIGVSTLGSVFFVGFWKAFLGSSFAMILESLDVKVKNIEIDDNILIPLISGVVMTLL